MYVMWGLIYLTHSFYSYCPVDASFFSFSILSVLLHTCLGVSIVFFFMLKKDPGYQQRKTLADSDNIIRKILKFIDNRQFNKIMPEHEICFDCLLKKPKHMEHCEECNLCVDGF